MNQLYDYHDSGNGYKVRLLLHHLGLPFTYHEVNILAGETRTPAFLKINANGRIPVLVTADGFTLSESNAILCYLAEGSSWLPADAKLRARVMQWMFWEQYNHEPNIATSRFLMRHRDPKDTAELLAQKKQPGLAALQLMDDHLADHHWFVGDGPTIADITLYAYTHVADQGGFPLDDYANIRRWLAAFAGMEGHIQLMNTEGRS